MAELFRFADYSQGELEKCAEAFVRPLLNERQIGCERIASLAWTEAILDWFSAARSEKVVVDARKPRHHGAAPLWRQELAKHSANFAPSKPRETRGEFLFDLSHSTYPPSDDNYWTADYWQKALAGEPRLELVLESEWGKHSLGEGNAALVMHDAIKLLHASARVKIVVFASTNPQSRKVTIDLARELVKKDVSKVGDAEPSWLWVDIPWSTWEDDDHKPTWWLGTAGADLSPQQ